MNNEKSEKCLENLENLYAAKRYVNVKHSESLFCVSPNTTAPTLLFEELDYYNDHYNWRRIEINKQIIEIYKVIIRTENIEVIQEISLIYPDFRNYMDSILTN